MRIRLAFLVLAVLAFLVAMPSPHAAPRRQAANGQAIFRFDTFGDEKLWTDTLRMHEVIQTSVSPATALSVGLKVDASALPPGLLDTADLNDPATTVELIRLNAVVGVVGKVTDGKLKSVGITCALCHSTVDDSVTAGIGQRLDGWPNLDLKPGPIIALSPALPADKKAAYNSWGAGFYDPRFSIDGINHPVRIPPAYGLKGVGFETYTGDGPVSYWNAYVAVTQMGGQGNFSDPRIGVDVRNTPDLVTSKLPALLSYQLSLRAPAPAAGSFDAAAAKRGAAVFSKQARCAECHIPPTYTDVSSGADASTPRLHDPAETGMDPKYASRTATKKYRATPLRALARHAPYFHDGSAATLLAVVNHYDVKRGLNLNDRQKADLVEFLKSL